MKKFYKAQAEEFFSPQENNKENDIEILDEEFPKIENKTRRIELRMRPSEYDSLKRYAKQKCLSVNAVIERAVYLMLNNNYNNAGD